MPRYLTQEHIDLRVALSRDLPERPGASASLQYVVTGSPEGEVRYWERIDDGVLTGAGLGELDGEPDIVVTMPWDVSVEIARGEIDTSAGFMQGRVKVSGNHGLLMSLLPVAESAEQRAVDAAVAAQTDY